MISADDDRVIAAQLGRPPRAVRDVGHRCPCGNPDVVVTEPRLEDGTPFPTLYYLTCPRVNSAVGRLEASGTHRDLRETSESYRRLPVVSDATGPEHAPVQG